jgi:hypothetical protein
MQVCMGTTTHRQGNRMTDKHHPTIESVPGLPITIMALPESAGWALHLGESITVMQMARLMQAFNCSALAPPGNARQLLLMPRVSRTPPPTLAAIQRAVSADTEPRLRVEPEPKRICTCYAPGSYPHDPDCRALMVEEEEC